MANQQDARGGGDASRVGLFIDYETIRFGLEDGYGVTDDNTELVGRLREVAEQYGRIIMANAYGDWTFSRDMAREFSRRQIQPRLALTDEETPGRPDISMALDVLESMLAGPQLDTYVIATNDDDFQEVLMRLKRSGRTVVVAGLEAQTSPELIGGSDQFVPLEELLGLKTGQPIKRIDFSMYDWAPFIQLMDEVEKNMPFVGLGSLVKKKLSSDNSGCGTSHEKQQLLDRAVEEGVVSLHKVENIAEAGEPVTACQLNREHPLVKEFVGA